MGASGGESVGPCTDMGGAQLGVRGADVCFGWKADRSWVMMRLCMNAAHPFPRTNGGWLPMCLAQWLTFGCRLEHGLSQSFEAKTSRAPGTRSFGSGPRFPFLLAFCSLISSGSFDASRS